MKIEKVRDAIQRLTIEIYNIKNKDYIFLSSKISKKFNLTASYELIYGFDEISQDYKNQEYTIGLEWDIWSGYIIVAKDKKSEKLINEIYDWLMIEGIPQRKSFFAKFIQLIK